MPKWLKVKPSTKLFLNADKGLLLQKLPFTLELKKFHINFYNTGMPKDFASDIVVTDKKTGERIEKTISREPPFNHQWRDHLSV